MILFQAVCHSNRKLRAFCDIAVPLVLFLSAFESSEEGLFIFMATFLADTFSERVSHSRHCSTIKADFFGLKDNGTFKVLADLRQRRD